VVTDDPAIAEHVRRARDLGQVRKYEHVLAGYNERLDTVQAAVLRRKLPHLDAWNASRRAAAAGYGAALAELDIDLPVEADEREHVWHLYVARSSERDAVRAALGEAGVATGLHYPLPLHLEPVLADLGHRRGEFPAAEDWSFRGFSLPMFAGIEKREVAAVSRALAAAT
jgi:dTDP-4-amino-4,6-dideoxygalactose transaminase